MIEIDRKDYFEAHRRAFGWLDQNQVNGIEAILDGMAEDEALGDIRHAAYMLATAWHETDKTMHPIREYGRGRGRKYGIAGPHNRQVAYGRGYVQLTWATNYARADKELQLGGALIADYDLAMRPDIAYRILSRGMIEGWFTGKRLGDYLRPGRAPDYIGARRVINGLDRAALIAQYARKLEGALAQARVAS